MSKARYIIDSLEKGDTMGRAKEILSKFYEFSREDMEAQNELLVSIQDWIKKQKLNVESVEKSPSGKSVIVVADRATRKDIDSSLYKIYGNGYKVTTSEKSSTYELK
jgi:hypothetical protein